MIILGRQQIRYSREETRKMMEMRRRWRETMRLMDEVIGLNEFILSWGLNAEAVGSEWNG